METINGTTFCEIHCCPVTVKKHLFWKKFEEKWDYLGHDISLLVHSQNCFYFFHRDSQASCAFMFHGLGVLKLFSFGYDYSFCIVPGIMGKGNFCRMPLKSLVFRVGCSSVVEHLWSIFEALFSISSFTKVNTSQSLSLNAATSSHWVCDLQPVIHISEHLRGGPYPLIDSAQTLLSSGFLPNTYNGTKCHEHDGGISWCCWQWWQHTVKVLTVHRETEKQMWWIKWETHMILKTMPDQTGSREEDVWCPGYGRWVAENS